MARKDKLNTGQLNDLQDKFSQHEDLKNVKKSDIDKILQMAAQMQNKQADDTVDGKDVIDIGADLGVSADNIKRAIQIQAAQKKNRKNFIFLTVGVILVFSYWIFLWSHDKMKGPADNIDGPSLSKESWTYSRNFNDGMPKDWGDENKNAKVLKGTLTVFHPGKHNGVYYVSNNKNFTNLIYETRVIFNHGYKDQDFGITFRYTDSDNFYNFGITSNGWFRIGKKINQDYKELVGWEEASVINKGNKSNLLRVDCQGDKFKFYINGKLVKELQDNSLGEGKIGFYSTHGVEASLDDLGVYELPNTIPSLIPGNTVSISNISLSTALSTKNWQNYWKFKDSMPVEWGTTTDYVKIMDNMFTVFYDKEKAGEGNYYAWSNLSLENFICEAKISFIKGYDDNGFGLAFRLTTDLKNMYRFGISANGSYIFAGHKDGNYRKLAGWHSCPLINKWKNPNILRVEAVGPKIKLFINGVQVQDYTDDQPLGAGNIGFYAAYQIMEGVSEIGINSIK